MGGIGASRAISLSTCLEISFAQVLDFVPQQALRGLDPVVMECIVQYLLTVFAHFKSGESIN